MKVFLYIIGMILTYSIWTFGFVQAYIMWEEYDTIQKVCLGIITPIFLFVYISCFFGAFQVVRNLRAKQRRNKTLLSKKLLRETSRWYAIYRWIW